MDYETFKLLVPQRIKEFLPPIFAGFTPQVRSVAKVGGMKDAFCMFPPEKPEMVAVPTLYLDDLYREYQENQDLDGTLEMIAQVIMTWSGIEVPELAGFCLSDHPDRIVANLICADMNRDLLREVPHHSFLDMAVIYRLVHSITKEGINSAIITNAMLEETDLTEEKLREHAMENTLRILPLQIIEDKGQEIFIVTNEAGFFGAAAMLYPEYLQSLAQKTGGDYYIMPTSIHEFFVIPIECAELRDLAQLLASGNESITRREERLSAAIYRYSAKDHILTWAAAYARAS